MTEGLARVIFVAIYILYFCPPVKAATDNESLQINQLQLHLLRTAEKYARDINLNPDYYEVLISTDNLTKYYRVFFMFQISDTLPRRFRSGEDDYFRSKYSRFSVYIDRMTMEVVGHSTDGEIIYRKNRFRHKN